MERIYLELIFSTPNYTQNCRINAKIVAFYDYVFFGTPSVLSYVALNTYHKIMIDFRGSPRISMMPLKH